MGLKEARRGTRKSVSPLVGAWPELGLTIEQSVAAKQRREARLLARSASGIIVMNVR